LRGRGRPRRSARWRPTRVLPERTSGGARPDLARAGGGRAAAAARGHCPRRGARDEAVAGAALGESGSPGERDPRPDRSARRGGVDDAALGGEVVARVGAHAANSAGALGLQETGGVLKRAAALISGDTGVMHMATGVGTPVVALFGPTVRQFGFFPYNAHATVLERDLPCRPCSAHGNAECPLGHHLCLRQITPDNVFTALCQILA